MESGPLVVKNGFGTSCLLFWQILIENEGVYAEFVTKTRGRSLIFFRQQYEGHPPRRQVTPNNRKITRTLKFAGPLAQGVLDPEQFDIFIFIPPLTPLPRSLELRNRRPRAWPGSDWPLFRIIFPSSFLHTLLERFALDLDSMFDPFG